MGSSVLGLPKAIYCLLMEETPAQLQICRYVVNFPWKLWFLTGKLWISLLFNLNVSLYRNNGSRVIFRVVNRVHLFTMILLLWVIMLMRNDKHGASAAKGNIIVFLHRMQCLTKTQFYFFDLVLALGIGTAGNQ